MFRFLKILFKSVYTDGNYWRKIGATVRKKRYTYYLFNDEQILMLNSTNVASWSDNPLLSTKGYKVHIHTDSRKTRKEIEKIIASVWKYQRQRMRIERLEELQEIKAETKKRHQQTDAAVQPILKK